MPVDMQGLVDDLFGALLTDIHSTTDLLRRPPRPDSHDTSSLDYDDHQPPIVEIRPLHSSTITISKSKYRNPDADKAALSTNLCELDGLLQDLSSAQFLEEVERRNAANTEESLPPDRDENGHRASSASQELDNLMACLSDFKMKGSPPHAVEEEVIQAMASRKAEASSDHLDAMMGNLNADMNMHGVSLVPKGDCAACEKPIVGQVITALGKLWHPEHFTCDHCKIELGTENFFERNNLSYCEHDYHTLFSPKCAACNGPILDKCVTALDKAWHPEHFVCAQCGNPFGEDGFHEKDGFAYCKADYFELFAPKCGNCEHAIMDNYISALGKQWHVKCFVCRECHMPFGSASFYEHEGFPFCETHYHAKRGSLCNSCQKPITGRCITAMYRKFHPEHFVCVFCLKQLNKGTFKEQKDKPYCNECFVKLFG